MEYQVILFAVLALHFAACKDLSIKMGALVPFDDKRMFSNRRLEPAGKIAVDRVYKHKILSQNIKLSVITKNSNCSEAVGMNEAINFYIRGDINVFFGPVCDFAAGPVVRQMTFWDLPIVSVGAIALDFRIRRKTVYPMLTRAGPANTESLVNFIVSIAKHKQWTHLQILYETEGHHQVVPKFCHLSTEVLITGIPQQGINLEYYKVTPGRDPSSMLTDKVANKHSGNSSTQYIAGKIVCKNLFVIKLIL